MRGMLLVSLLLGALPAGAWPRNVGHGQAMGRAAGDPPNRGGRGWYEEEDSEKPGPPRTELYEHHFDGRSLESEGLEEVRKKSHVTGSVDPPSRDGPLAAEASLKSQVTQSLDPQSKHWPLPAEAFLKTPVTQRLDPSSKDGSFAAEAFLKSPVTQSLDPPSKDRPLPAEAFLKSPVTQSLDPPSKDRPLPAEAFLKSPVTQSLDPPSKDRPLPAEAFLKSPVTQSFDPPSKYRPLPAEAFLKSPVTQSFDPPSKYRPLPAEAFLKSPVTQSLDPPSKALPLPGEAFLKSPVTQSLDPPSKDRPLPAEAFLKSPVTQSFDPPSKYRPLPAEAFLKSPVTQSLDPPSKALPLPGEAFLKSPVTQSLDPPSKDRPLPAEAFLKSPVTQSFDPPSKYRPLPAEAFLKSPVTQSFDPPSKYRPLPAEAFLKSPVTQSFDPPSKYRPLPAEAFLKSPVTQSLDPPSKALPLPGEAFLKSPVTQSLDPPSKDGSFPAEAPVQQSRVIRGLGHSTNGQQSAVAALDESSRPSQHIWIPQGGEDSPRPWAATDQQQKSSSGVAGSVCTVKLRPKDAGVGGLLEVSGVLSGYESAFVEDLRTTRWGEDGLGVFGLCARGGLPATLPLLTHLAAHLAEPRDHRLIVLHLEEVKWGLETRLLFQVMLEEESFPLEEPESALLVFYPEEKGKLQKKPRITFAAAGGGHHQKQAVCLSEGTRYLVLSVGSTDRSFMQGKLHFTLTLQLWHDEKAVAMDEELQRWLFGTDDKCFTRMTPALFLLVKKKSAGKENRPPSISWTQNDGEDLDVVSDPEFRQTQEIKTEAIRTPDHVEYPPLVDTDIFLEILAKFVGKVLSSFKEQTETLVLPIDSDNQTLETSTSNPFNVSEKAAIEWLVESEEPLVFLFPKGSQTLLERHFVQGKLEGKLLEKLMEKFHAVLEELLKLPVIRDNAKLLKHLLDHCYGSFDLGRLSGPRGMMHKEGSHGHKKLHSLLMLKAMQTVRAYWKKRTTLSRQNRSTDSKAFCQLQELTMKLRFEHEHTNIILPTKYVAYNCEGPCVLPQHTVSETNNHVILLIKMRDSGAALGRGPCCVPEKYGKLSVWTLTEDGLLLRPYPNMIAEECGCR
ncbi:muellerian-inhibiting factor [Lissotriton helveticus]